MKIIWTDEAVQRLAEIHDYISADNLRAANAVAQRVQDAVAKLQAHPHLGRQGDLDTRELIVAGLPYIVVYRVQHDSIAIISVVHGAQASDRT